MKKLAIILILIMCVCVVSIVPTISSYTLSAIIIDGTFTGIGAVAPGVTEEENEVMSNTIDYFIDAVVNGTDSDIESYFAGWFAKDHLDSFDGSTTAAKVNAKIEELFKLTNSGSEYTWRIKKESNNSYSVLMCPYNISDKTEWPKGKEIPLVYRYNTRTKLWHYGTSIVGGPSNGDNRIGSASNEFVIKGLMEMVNGVLVVVS